jgi:anti-sigma factor RsiW
MKDKIDRKRLLMDRYMDGDLDEKQAKEFEQLLERSPELRKELESARAVRDALCRAMQSEVEQVDFQPVWTAVHEAIEREEQPRSRGFVCHMIELFRLPRVAAAAATVAVLVLGVFIVWHFMLAPVPGEAALTSVDIQYGDDLDIVISVDTLGDSATTVVWIQNFSVDQEILEE